MAVPMVTSPGYGAKRRCAAWASTSTMPGRGKFHERPSAEANHGAGLNGGVVGRERLVEQQFDALVTQPGRVCAWDGHAAFRESGGKAA